jgi:mRNA-degrading endonuclease toxin of MazEF toxin-antitoxin module
MPRQRDIYLAPFPYSDVDAEKRRPVLVISNSIHNAGGSDLIVMAITSNLSAANNGIDISTDLLDEGSLPVASRILPLKIYAIAQSRLEKYVGRLNPDPFGLAIQALNEAICPQ